MAESYLPERRYRQVGRGGKFVIQVERGDVLEIVDDMPREYGEALAEADRLNKEELYERMPELRPSHTWRPGRSSGPVADPTAMEAARREARRQRRAARKLRKQQSSA